MVQQTHRIHVPIIAGPTAAGKTALALRIAEARRWDIVSCDSRQMYRGMDIGTAKPARGDRERVHHWLMDALDPSERYSAFSFVQDAGKIIRNLSAQGKTALLCGGTGLYIRSLRNGMGPVVESDPAVVDALMKRAAAEGSEQLHRELALKDPDSALAIHVNDAQRLVRALAVHMQTGRKLSELRRMATVPPADLCFTAVVIMPPRDLLYDRINRRVDDMVRQGLWDEFVALRTAGYDEHSPGLATVGYHEFFAVERNKCSLAVAIEKIKQHSRQYAKRQITWFRTHCAGELMEYADDGRLNDRDVLAAITKKLVITIAE
ncbi:MAG: tRNA (adenosine(37)-N6)-dimethylallyltransferase MiaA [Chitinispirillaceae bacterium]|jgi:tRNA dimethylallyltransferase|nr:tRNA (adenosine(37)-N6)-dimethylallyltransferase MiaA [Chitinispirillaceae bacterium]